MRLKQTLRDFGVEEMNRFTILKKGRFRLYMLEKRGLENFSLFRYLAKQNSVPMPVIGYAGLKDKHAITRQYFTIPEKYKIRTLKEKNFDITFLGYVNKGIKLGELEGNKFKLIVRDLKKEDIKDIDIKIKDIKTYGVPNYFDSQRFGSVIAKKFIAKFVIKKNYEEAVKLYLTYYSKNENKELKHAKRLIYQNWNKLTQLDIKHSSLNKVINEYKRTKSWLAAYIKIPDYLREMHISSYQSYIWNECVKEVIKDKIDKNYVYPVKYRAGTLLFYKKSENLPLVFPSIGDYIEPSDYERNIINKVLVSEGLEFKDFNIKKETGKFFVSRSRKLILEVTNLNMTGPESDELNKNRFKIGLSFSLLKGSYATMVTKMLFGY